MRSHLEDNLHKALEAFAFNTDFLVHFSEVNMLLRPSRQNCSYTWLVLCWSPTSTARVANGLDARLVVVLVSL